jgi:two-component system phosphate regulon sensor histidine kinase PhoR
VPYDRDRMMQVVSNVLQNAIKFTPAGGSIRVSVKAADADVTVGVTDSGDGIPKEELSSVFERFKQLDAERSGLGLGLYISKWIVEAHGGQIWADSQSGKGATFWFTLPR